MDFKKNPPVSLIKPMQSRSQKTIQPKQPPSFSPNKHQVKRTPEFPGEPELIKFATPEKHHAHSPLTLKTQFSVSESVKATPAGVQRTLFPAKSSTRLTHHTGANAKLNPKFLIPVLSARKHLNKLSKSSIDFDPANKEPQFMNNDSFSNSPETIDRPSSPDKLKDIERPLKISHKLKNFLQSDTESEDPLFLSDRVSYECDSEQSLKIDMHKFELFSASATSDSQNRGKMGLADQCTQTEELEAALNNLDRSEIRSGMEFLGKIYNLLQPLSNT